MTDDLGLTTRCPKCGSVPFSEEYRHATIYFADINKVGIVCRGCGFAWTVDPAKELKNPEIFKVNPEKAIELEDNNG